MWCALAPAGRTCRPADVDSLSWADVCAQRLVRHSLTTARPAAELADVVGTICGAHAQVMSAAEVSIGLRTEKVTQTEVRDALWRDRTLVKTFGPRGTVHLLPADELPLWTSALGAVPPSSNGLAPDARLSPEQLKQVVAAIAEALDGPELTVDELGGRVVAATGAWAADPVVPGFTDMWPRWRPPWGPPRTRACCASARTRAAVRRTPIRGGGCPG